MKRIKDREYGLMQTHNITDVDTKNPQKNNRIK